MQSKPTPAMDMKIKQDRFYSALWDSPSSKTNGKLLLELKSMEGFKMQDAV